jgi:uncharacterized phage protein (TIGR02220 family)
MQKGNKMAIRRHSSVGNFTIISNNVLSRADMSLKAKGLLAFMASKPDDWKFTIRTLASQCGKDGEGSVKNTVDELKKEGYVNIWAKKTGGKIDEWIWDITFEPWKFPEQEEDLPDVRNPHVEKPHVENRHNTNNIYNNNYINKTEILKKDNICRENEKPTFPDPLSKGQQVLDYLNERAPKSKKGRVRRFTTDTFIKPALKKYSVDDLKLIIDWWDKVYIRKHPDMVEYFDYQTPFRKSKIERYLELARDWDEDGANSDFNGKQGVRERIVITDEDRAHSGHVVRIKYAIDSKDKSDSICETCGCQITTRQYNFASWGSVV